MSQYMIIGVLLQCLFYSLIFADNSDAQNRSINEIYISLDVDGRVETAFDELERITDFKFTYNRSKVDLKQNISINAENETLAAVLKSISKQSDLKFKRINNVISVSKREKYALHETIEVEEIFQIKTITGKVTSAENNDALPGVNVFIQGTSSGTVTDLDGQYVIEIPSSETTLVFSYVGYLTSTIQVGEQSVIDIELVPDISILSEIVVTALGIEKESRSLSYNVQELTGESVNTVADANFVNNLYGKVAGVTINSSSSGVGGASRVIMRGVKSISGNNNALYVIDGIPMPNLSTEQPGDVFSGAGQTGDGISNLNPDDIESISVLSGPAAAALYGSSAANGVVLITTKKGQKDRVSINVTNSTTFSDPLILPEFQNTYGQSEAGSYYSWGDKLALPSSYDPADFFQTGINITNTASLSTGTEKNQMYLSAGTVNSQGVVHNNNYDRYNFSFRNTSNFINDKMKLDVGFMTSNVNEQNMVAQGQYFNPLVPLYLYPAGDDFSKVEIFERYEASRNFKTQFWPYGDQGLSMQNPYWVTERGKFTNRKERYMANASLSYELTDWISISGRIKMDKSNERFEKKFNASTNTLFASDNGYYSLNQAETRQIYGEALVNIDKYFLDHTLSLTANVGANFENINYDQDLYGGKLLGVANLFTYSNVNPSTAESSQSGHEKKKQSVFASAQVGYRGLVYLDMTARNDWASTLANSNTKSFFYPSIGLSGIISDMFDYNSEILPYVKVRGSYSEVGNEPDLFLTIPTYALSGGYPQTQTRMPNTDLRPERTKSWEVGLNMGFFRNALTLDATIYQSSTYNQFFEPTLSSSSGYTSVIVNAGQVDNKGMEITLRYNKDLGKINWSSYMTYSLNRNEIVTLLDGWENPETGDIISLSELDMGGTGSYKMILKEGGSMGDIYVNTLRTDEHGAIYVDPSTQTVVAEINKFVKAGSSTPDYNLGWGNNLSWNRLSLGFLFTARVGGIVVSNTQSVMDAFGASQASADARDEGGALVNGRRIPAKEYYQTIGGASGGVGSMYTYSATNVRLSELTVSYDVPVASLGNWIQGINVAFIGRNLFLLYNKAPYDPEITANTGTYYQGVDYFMMPSLRNMGFSVKLKF